MFQRPDIATQMKTKEVLVPGGLVAEELVAKSCRSRGQDGGAVAGGYPELHRVCRCRRRALGVYHSGAFVSDDVCGAGRETLNMMKEHGLSPDVP